MSKLMFEYEISGSLRTAISECVYIDELLITPEGEEQGSSVIVAVKFVAYAVIDCDLISSPFVAPVMLYISYYT